MGHEYCSSDMENHLYDMHNPGYDGNYKYPEASSSMQGLENSLLSEFGLESEMENTNSQADEEKRSGMQKFCF